MSSQVQEEINLKKIQFALIGCGRISPNHIACAQELQEIEIKALCDIDRNTAEALAEKFDLVDVHIYTNYQEMLEQENPALVAIATDSKTHAEIAAYCIKKGCHVIIEKPIALSISDAENLVQLAEKHGVVVSACHQNRFNKAVVKLKDTIDKNSIGRLFHLTANIRWNRGEDYYKQAGWRGKWDADGGALMNQCIHNIDLLQWLAGVEIEEVFAYTDNLNHPYIEAEDIGIALVKFKGNTYGVIEGTTNIYPKNFEETLSIFGEKGTVKIGGKSVNALETFLVNGFEGQEEEIKKAYSEEPQNIYGFGHKHLYKDVVQSIREGRAPLVTAQDGKNAVELVLAIYQSAHTGIPVKLPINDISTTDFAGRFNR